MQTSIEPSSEGIGWDSSAQTGREPSSQAQLPPWPRSGALPSSHPASLHSTPAATGEGQTALPLPFAAIGSVPCGQTGSEPSAQEKEPSPSLTGREPSSQIAGFGGGGGGALFAAPCR